MSTTISDKAMDVFMANQYLYQMNTENLEDFSERINTRLDSLILGARETEVEKLQDEDEDDYEEPPYNEVARTNCESFL